MELARRLKQITDPYEPNEISTIDEIYKDMKENPFHYIEYLLDLIERIKE